MKNRKLIQIMMITIAVMLIITTIGIVANTIRLESVKKSSIYRLANNIDNLSAQSIDTTESNASDNEGQATGTQEIPELREASINDANISSRSEVDRQDTSNEEEILVNTEAEQPEEYEEIVQYTKLEDIKISFDMDVSKTTGVSKEDFIYLVENMKYDKTGILARNAGWIWECCQKYSVNEIFVLGICGIESGWCSASQHRNTHNYSSLMSGGKLIAYPSDEAGFEAMIKLLGQKYLTPGASLYHGATITGVGKCYCNPTSWPKKVYTCMQQALQ